MIVTANSDTGERPEADADSCPPLFSVGMIADIQYAPIPDGFSFTGTPRYYRHALEATEHAFEKFRDYRCSSWSSKTDDHNDDGSGVDMVINLGDIIDGKCQEIAKNGGVPPESDHPGMICIQEVQEAMTPYLCKSRKVLHSYGNHCLYNLNRTELRETLGIPFRKEDDSSAGEMNDDHNRKNGGETVGYHSGDSNNDGDLVGYHSYIHPPISANGKTVSTSIKFIVLDGYDIALMRRSPVHSEKRRVAVEILQRENGINFAKGNGQENSPEGLEGIQKRFVAFNGAIGPTQLEWLHSELRASRQEEHQKVVILSHQPICPGSSNPVCLLWNYQEVLEILREYSDVVVASFCGHAHKGGYIYDESSNIHFRVIEAVLESKPPTKTFGILDVYGNRLELKGFGDCKSAVFPFHDQIRESEHTSTTETTEEAVSIKPSQ